MTEKTPKFSFWGPDKIYIAHNFEPEMHLEIIKLPKPYDYASVGVGLDDIFDEGMIRGWHFVFKVVWIADEDEIEDYTHIRSIIRRAGKWYSSRVISGEIPLESYVAPEAEMETERFKLQEHTKPGWWLVTDKQYKVCIEFRNGKFNETQRVVPLEDFNPDDFMLMSRIMREIGDWLSVEHREKV